jgi:hypothetical protein
VTILADGQIFFGHGTMCLIEIGCALKRNRVNYCARTVSVSMALAQSGLVEAVNFGDAALQLRTVAFTALITILLVGRPVRGQPRIRMLIDAA